MLQPVSTLEGNARLMGTIWPTTYYMHASLGAYTKGLGLDLMVADMLYLLGCIPVLLLISAFALNKQEK
jgi:ribosome-dependent ATPase